MKHKYCYGKYCTTDDCREPTYAKGMCKKHYDRYNYSLHPEKQMERNKKHRKKTLAPRFTKGRARPPIDFNEDFLYHAW